MQKNRRLKRAHRNKQLHLGKKHDRTKIKTSIKSRSINRRISGKKRRRSGRSVSRYVERKQFKSGHVLTKDILKKLPGRGHKRFSSPVGKNYDSSKRIFFNGQNLPKRKYQSIAVLLQVVAFEYARTKNVLWWRRVKEFKPMTLAQWSEKLKTPNFQADLAAQVDFSNGQYVDMVGFEGVK